MQPFYLGLDVSKGYADLMIIDSRKEPVIKGFQLDDTFEGHNRLYDILSGFLSKHKNSQLFAAVESTGGYENNWYETLQQFQDSLNIQTARLNPLGVMHSSKADLKKNTTDRISARNVAEYLVAHPEKVSYQSKDQLAGLRKLWMFIKMLIKQRTQVLNELNTLLYIAAPELLVYCRDGVPDWVLHLTVKYPGAAKLKKARTKSVARIPRVTITRAQDLIAEAKRSVASATDSVTQQLIKDTARQILHLNTTIAKQKKYMIEQCQMPEVKLLKSFTGISDWSAVGLLIEIQTVTRFASAKKLASFFGLHPVYKISGDGIGAIKMSKQGRRAPRQILYMVALSAIKSNPLITQVYEKHQQRGKSRKAAIGICMHKILRIIYGMLKHNRPFDPSVDIANQQRSNRAGNAIKVNANARRYQPYDTKAPVTKGQQKKRMERKRSHSVDDTTPGITDPVPLGEIIAEILPQL